LIEGKDIYLFSKGRCKSCAQKVSSTLKKLKTKEKSESISSLVKELDTVFSLYIRLRYADKEGMVTCYTSGKVVHWRKIQAGHFISRRHYNTRWNEINVQNQTVRENIMLSGNIAEFGRRLVGQYGQDKIDYLFQMRDKEAKLDRLHLKVAIQDYTKKVAQLKESLGIE
jgi:Bacteriophage Lambda NinG protein